MCRMCLVSSDPQAVENIMPHPTADTNKDEETHSATDGNDGTLAGSADAPAPLQTSQVAPNEG